MSDHYAEPEVLKPKRDWGAYLFLAPALAVVALFFVYPIAWMVLVSSAEYNPVTAAPRFTGLAYYAELLKSVAMWRTILNTAYFSGIYIPLTLVSAGLIALLLARTVRSRPLLKAVFCTPYLMPVVALALIWRAAYMPNTGPIDRLLYMLGVEHRPDWPGWLAQPYLATPAIALMCVWRDTGFFALILLAALVRVPRQAYELAQVDGASPCQTFLHVTLPACSGALALTVALLIINVQNLFQEILVMTEDGGPANWTLNIPFLIYRRAYGDYDWGHAAALSVIFFAVTAVVILIFNRILKRRLGWS